MPALAGSLTGGNKPIVVAEGADVRVGSVGVGVGERTGIGTMATSICPREATAITTTTAAEQAQTFQFGPITLSRSDDLKRTLIFFRQCKLGASLRRGCGRVAAGADAMDLATIVHAHRNDARGPAGGTG